MVILKKTKHPLLEVCVLQYLCVNVAACFLTQEITLNDTTVKVCLRLLRLFTLPV